MARYMKRRVVVDFRLSPSHTQKATLFPSTPRHATQAKKYLRMKKK
jgi:hypothetical protein